MIEFHKNLLYYSVFIFVMYNSCFSNSNKQFICKIYTLCSIYINSSMFQKGYQTSLKASGNDESVVHPLPTLFQLLGLSPFKKVMLV